MSLTFLFYFATNKNVKQMIAFLTTKVLIFHFTKQVIRHRFFAIKRIKMHKLVKISHSYVKYRQIKSIKCDFNNG